MHGAEEAISEAGIFYDPFKLFERLERGNGMKSALLALLPQRGAGDQG
jgi:hypothetical protein